MIHTCTKGHLLQHLLTFLCMQNNFNPCWPASSLCAGLHALLLMGNVVQVLASVPDLDIVAYLPLFLSSLMECLTDPLSEVRSKAAKVLQVSIPPSWLP